MAWVASGLALAAGGGLAIVSGSWVPQAWMLVFASRSAVLLSPLAARWSAVRIGIGESILGLLAVITTGIAW